MSFIELKNVSKSIKKNSILKNINLEVNINEFVCIIGKSGSGKTSLLNVLGLLDNSYKGNVIVNNKKINKHNRDRYRSYLCTFVFQDYGLIPYLDIKSNINTFLNANNKDFYGKLLNEFNLQHKETSKIEELSGGEKQRFALIKASLKNSKIVIADEPTGSLDSENSEKIMLYLKNNNEGKCIIMATHNIELARKYATRIITIDAGSIINDEKIANTNKIDEIQKVSRVKKKNISNQIKSSINFLKMQTKQIVPLVFLVSLCLSFITLIFGTKSGFKNYIDSISLQLNDSRIFEFSDENKEKMENFLKKYQINYKENFNYNYVFNNFLKRELTKENFLNFDYKIVVLDFDNNPSLKNKSPICFNNMFYDFYQNNSIDLNFNYQLLGETIQYANSYQNIEQIKEPKMYNLSKIYIDVCEAEKIVNNQIKEYLKIQDLLSIPREIYIFSPLTTIYKAINDAGNIHFEGENFKEANSIIIDSPSYVFYGPLTDLINSLSILLIILVVILIIIIYSSFSILLKSFYLKRKREFAIEYAFGENESEIRFRLFVQNSIIIGISLVFSLLISLIIYFIVNPYLVDQFSMNIPINIVEIEPKGLTCAFFCSLLLILLSINVNIKKNNNALLEELKNE